MSDSTGHILFERVDPKVNASKYYQLSFEMDLSKDAPYVLMTTWGRYHVAPRRRVQSFQDYWECKRTIQRIAQTRLNHGYRIVECKAFKPLQEWLVAHKGHFAPRCVLRLFG